MGWSWAPITPEEELAGDRVSGPDELRYDERWLALVLLATQANAGTRAGYRRDINTFMRWFSELRPPALSTATRPLEASRSDIEQYAAWLAAIDPPLAAATRARRLAVVSAFYDLAEQHDLIVRTPMRGVRRPTVENEDAHLGLDGDQADELLRTAERWPDREEGTLVVLLLLCGLRISEALGIRAVDITPRERGRKAEVRIRRKGRDHRTVFDIDDEQLAGRLATLAATTAADRPVFGLDRFQAGRALARIGREAGIDPPPHPHILRHTFCAHLLQAGLDAREVQRLAGHRDLRTTQRYVDALKRSSRPVSSLLRMVFSEIRDELDTAA
jgi:integrase/recombinase XerC